VAGLVLSKQAPDSHNGRCNSSGKHQKKRKEKTTLAVTASVSDSTAGGGRVSASIK